MKIRFRNFLKYFGVIEKDKIEEFVKISKQMKHYIERHQNNDPNDKDTQLNELLYGSIDQSLKIIQYIKGNNIEIDWDK